MSRGTIKARVEGAYAEALSNRNMTRSRSSGLDRLFYGLCLYGRDAGTDFAETHLAEIVQEAVATAECKAGEMSVFVHRSGDAAIEGIASALRERTGLMVDVEGKKISLRWAPIGNEPGFR